jgi:hypothetical protein
VQVTVTNATDAFDVTTSGGTASVALTNDVSALPCDKHIAASWSPCASPIEDGQGCVLLSIPCPSAIVSAAPDQGCIACPSNVASQPPINVPTETTLDIRLQYDDGVTRALRYPPSNGGQLQMTVTSGAGSCEVDYDGIAAPIVRTTSGATCTYGPCTVQLNYTEPCGMSLVRDVDVLVCGGICLQPSVQCPDVANAPWDDTQLDGILACTAEAAQLRELSCTAAGYQQRTLWTALLMSPMPDKPNGEPSIMSSYNGRLQCVFCEQHLPVCLAAMLVSHKPRITHARVLVHLSAAQAG